MRGIAVAAACVLLFGSAAHPAGRPQGPQDPPGLTTALAGFDRFYTDGLAAQGIVGSSLMVVHDHRVVYQRQWGKASLEDGRPVDADTIFHWASITKTFTGIAIMQLRDRGLLSLDDPIVKYVPELREVHDPFGPIDAVTIRMLLSHTAGFRGPTWPWGGDQPWHPFEPLHWSQLVAMMPYTEILFPPGSRYSYSNLGVVFLGQVIERLTTDDYEVYIDKNILKPLEMHRAYFDATPYHLQKYRARSYFWKDGKPEPATPDHNTGITVSNGGLNAPLTDMVKYLDFLIGNPARRDVYEGILKRSSLEEMWHPVAPVESSAGSTVSMGLAFFVEEHGGIPFIAHSGGQNAFISHFYVNPDSRTAYIVAFNTNAEPDSPDGRGNARELDRQIRDYLVKNVFPLFRRGT